MVSALPLEALQHARCCCPGWGCYLQTALLQRAPIRARVEMWHHPQSFPHFLKTQISPVARISMKAPAVVEVTAKGSEKGAVLGRG